MTEETAGTPRTEPGLPQEQKYIRADDYIEKLEREVAALTTQRDESESQKLGWKKLCENWNEQANKGRQPDAFYEDYNEGTMRAMQALMTRAIERAEAAEAQRDELQKRIGYTAVPLVAGGANIDALEHALSLGDQLADWINLAGPAMQNLADAYERRIRSLCSTPEEIEKRPWECAEWLRATSVLRDKPVAIVIIDSMQATGTDAATTLPTNGTEGLRAELDAAKRNEQHTKAVLKTMERDLREQLDAAKRALAELVACKDLKDEIDQLKNWIATHCSRMHHAEGLAAKEADYARRKPLAWKAARATLAAKSTEQKEEG